MTEITHRNALKPGHRIGSYEIIRILGQGGFGITYLASDTDLNRHVAIKEYLPVELAFRESDTSVHPVSGEHTEQYNWGLDRFISEAQTLAKFKHPGIVSVLTIVRENNTAYIVMEYEHGRPFSHILKERKTIPESELKSLLLPVMDGLECIHGAGFIHRDIKPPNIYIREDGSPVLIDFGSARQSLIQHTRTLTTLVSPGYAPFEQYTGKSDKQGPWTDIYGLGATLFRSVTGISPIDSMERSESLIHTGKDLYVSAAEIAAKDYSPEFLMAIDRAMAFKAEDRPQSIADWRGLFESEIQKGVSPAVTSEAPTVAADIPTRKIEALDQQDVAPGLVDKINRLIWKSVRWGLVLIVLLVVIRVILPGNKRNNVQQEPPRETLSENDSQPSPGTTLSTDSQSATVETISDTSPVATDRISDITDQVERVPQVNPVTQPSSIDKLSESNSNAIDEAGAGDNSRLISRIPVSDRRKLQAIRDKLRENRRDRQARLELNELANDFEEKIKTAIRRGDYEQARAYVYAIQMNSDKNSQAYTNLQELMNVIDKMEIQKK